MTQRRAPGLIAAIDTTDVSRARVLAQALQPHCGLIKLGLEFYLAHGAQGVRQVTQAPIFLDLKLHDIPNTVAGGVRAVLPVRPAMLTIHASGGPAMIEAASKAVRDVAHPPLVLAVTVLTSLDEATTRALGWSDPPREQVVRLARLALAAGANGLVCSAHEVAPLRDALGDDPVLVVPGIRPAGAALGDQARVMTPTQAVQAGADWLVVGRPITEAPDPAQAAARIAAEIATARGS